MTKVLLDSSIETEIFWEKHGNFLKLYDRSTQHIPVDPVELTVFTFIRHPLEWYRSYWRYRESGRLTVTFDPPGPWPKLETLLDPIDRCGSPNFDEFIRKVIMLGIPSGFVSWLYSTYIPNNSVLWGKQETLKDDLKRILKELGHHIDPKLLNMPKENVSHHPNPKWDPNLARQLAEIENRSMNRFKYTLDDVLGKE